MGAAEGVNVIPPPKELREVSLVASNQTKSNASKITIGDRIKDTARSWMNKLNEPKSEKTIEQHLNDSVSRIIIDLCKVLFWFQNQNIMGELGQCHDC